MPISNPASLLDITNKMRLFCSGVLAQMNDTQARLREAQLSDVSAGDRVGLDNLLRREEERLQQIRRQWENLNASIENLNRKIVDLSDANEELMRRY